MGIRGSFNTNGNDGTITRFGWKAQNKSLLIFAGEAYNVESGVTNENFPNERGAIPGCVLNGLEDPSPGDGTTSDLVNFGIFMRLLAPPTPALLQGVAAESARNGLNQFGRIGWALCHSPTLTPAVPRLPACLTSPTDLSLTSLSTTWVRTYEMASSRGLPVRTSSAPLLSGGWASGCFSCTMDALVIYCRLSRPTPTAAAVAVVMIMMEIMNRSSRSVWFGSE